MFSSYKAINLLRGNLKFAKIPEDNAEYIFIKNARSSLANNKKKNKNTCKISKDNMLFEPNSSSKGKVARSCAYFFTRYPEFLPIMPDVIDINTMVEWHEKFPPRASEIKRENAIFRVQKNHNPYITQPVKWMRQIWLSS